MTRAREPLEAGSKLVLELTVVGPEKSPVGPG